VRGAARAGKEGAKSGGNGLTSQKPPAPGTPEDIVRVGKLVFFTGLGVPDDDSIFATPIQNIKTLAFRGEASSNGWSSWFGELALVGLDGASLSKTLPEAGQSTRARATPRRPAHSAGALPSVKRRLADPK
jgi:hypothetical protein